MRGGWDAFCTPEATPQSPAVTPLTRPGPSVAARHLPTLWGVTPQGEPLDSARPQSLAQPSNRKGDQWSPLHGSQKAACRGRRPRRPEQIRAAAKPHGATINVNQHGKPQLGTIPRGVEDAAPYGQHENWQLPGAGPLGGQNDGRQPAELARSCGSMPHWGIDRYATPQQRASAPTERVVEENLAPEGSMRRATEKR